MHSAASPRPLAAHTKPTPLVVVVDEVPKMSLEPFGIIYVYICRLHMGWDPGQVSKSDPN